ncbi:MAG TPA: carboxypeptidase-like regulatory domain-containing protein [Pyrinomonadaceae bacterium]|nr:carboxypeptidase-like regulatory domain-containing protein [Pyrinomonadaceae bacterium]
MQNSHKRIATAVAIVLFVFTAGQVQAQTFSGQATAVKATVTTGGAPGVTTAVSDTGPLPSAGGTITVGSASANIANILTAGASTVSTSGSGSTSTSTASIATLDVNPVGLSSTLRVRADAVAATTNCNCGNIICSGVSTLTNLQVGATVITVSGDANQTSVFTAGTQTLTLTINQQIVSPSSKTTNALYILITDSATGTSIEVIVSSAHSDIVCGLNPSFDRYSGRATGVRLAQTLTAPASSVTSLISDTGYIPTAGGSILTSVASANVAGLISTGAVVSSSSGGLPGGNADTSQSMSTVNNLNATLVGAVTISATVLQSNTSCNCGVSPACSGGSTITSLAVIVAGLPVSITITGSPNQIVPLPLGVGSLILNEQIATGTNDITVNALHVLLTPVGLASTDLVIASSHSDIQCSLSPTAGRATLAGRVTGGSGTPVAHAEITATSQDGTVWRTMTTSFGSYTMDLPVGESYLVVVRHKRYEFEPRTLTFSDNVADFDFVANGK